jgi:hypothetical protein
MKLLPQRIEETKTLNYFGEDLAQTAKITIQFVNDEGSKKTGFWEFVKCEYKVPRGVYSKEDFDFLAAINDKIKELIK